jgi:transposase-like protein
MLEAELTEYIGAAPYKRAEKHTGQRNSYKPRALRQSTRYRYLLENFHIAWHPP